MGRSFLISVFVDWTDLFDLASKTVAMAATFFSYLTNLLFFLGERLPKNRAKIFQKVHKNAFFWLVFSKTCKRRRKSSHNGVFIVIWENSENQFGRPKKRSKKIRPLEKILDPPLYLTVMTKLPCEDKTYSHTA